MAILPDNHQRRIRRWPPARRRPPSSSNGRLQPSTSVGEAEPHDGTTAPLENEKRKYSPGRMNRFGMTELLAATSSRALTKFGDGKK